MKLNFDNFVISYYKNDGKIEKHKSLESLFISIGL